MAGVVRVLRTSAWREAQEVAALNQAMDAHEGCNVVGWLDVQRVAGNFHISVHAEDFLMLTKASGASFEPGLMIRLMTHACVQCKTWPWC